ncbi:MAG: GNAT family N-acetyltransferase [Clostridia bacterium]|nr:GNAT family N-acetyltransferase [Clostridia bacterium]
MMKECFLIRPCSEYAEEIAQYRQEFLAAGSSMDGTGPLRKTEDPHAYIKACEKSEKGENLPSSYVPATQFLFIRRADNRLVGMLQVRHYLNEHLLRFGGHIGYSVRPSERRRGYAKAMLQAALPFCREMGIKKVLITCDENNPASEKTILANGGKYESTAYEPDEKINLKRFWIEL